MKVLKNIEKVLRNNSSILFLSKIQLKKIFLCFNLLLVILYSISSSIFSYHSFYELEMPKNLFLNSFQKISSTKWFSSYTEIAGVSTSYGFFAPNVLSSSILYIEDNGVKYEIQPNNKDSMIRLNTFYSSLLKFELDKSFNKLGVETSSEKNEMYNDLIYKNILAYYKSNYSISDNAKIKLDLYEFPSLKNFKNASVKGEFFNISSYEFAK